MTGFSTQAIMLRRIAYGDADLIITFFTLRHGKIAAIAKSAKKSMRRFQGILEPFCVLQIVCGTGRGKLPILQEASLVQPFAGIRGDMLKTSYASYWAEIVNDWMEADEKQERVYHLLCHFLGELEGGQLPGMDLSILFQMRFLTLAGLSPNLARCAACKTDVDGAGQRSFGLDLSRGGLVCSRCDSSRAGRFALSTETIKQLRWVQKVALPQAARMRFSQRARREAQALLEAFVPYHLGKTPRSLQVLKQVRDDCNRVGRSAEQ